MSLVRRAAFEQFRRQTLAAFKPLPQKGFEAIRNRLVAALESDPSVIVEKVHYTSHPDSMIEIVCAWVGLDASQEAAIASFTAVWNDQILGAEQQAATIDPQDDLVYLLFAGQMPEGRFITGKILLRA